MIIIVGLGNVGREYDGTRHNAGFLAVDDLRARLGFDDFKEDKKYSGLIAFGKVRAQKLVLLKPATFMNESGRSVRALLDFYKLPPTTLIVIHDDVDLPSGKFRTTDSSRAAGHNGVQDIVDHLGTQDFFRIRLGIGRPTPENGICTTLHDYVLQKFTAEEKEGLERLFPEVKKVIETRLK